MGLLDKIAQIGMPGATLASAGIGAVGSAINGALGILQAKKDREFNAEQALLNRNFQTEERLASQEYNLDMWNLNNEYNDIGSQLARARSAGVNASALLGGDYKTATSSPVATTASQGATASSSSGGAIGSALINSTAPLLGSVSGSIKSLVDSKATETLLPYNVENLKSQVSVNLASLQKIASEVGLNDATRENIERSTFWMDGLSRAKILEQSSHATLMYNQNFELFQRIEESKNRMKNDDAITESTVAYNSANIDYINSQKIYQDILNKYGEKFQIAQLTQEEVAAVEAEKRKEFANTYGIPLGSSEFEFNWALQCKGKFAEYCQKVVTVKEQSTWKPIDWRAPAGTYARQYNPLTGVFNPKWKSSEAEYNLLDRKTPMFSSVPALPYYK